jgi:hypothetical protein
MPQKNTVVLQKLVQKSIVYIFATKRDYMLPKIVVFGFAMDCKVQAST